jgi:2-succinyl-5-enolpyruvyl-6-hydroxy-3-cyclohexene-1-carboxylate synthase
VVNTWLAGLDATQVLVDPHGAWTDPDRTAEVVAACDPTVLCLALAQTDVTAADPDWLEGWAAAERVAQTAIAEALRSRPEPTEPGTARDVVAALPDGAALVVSSSMPVRDVEWYSVPRDGVRIVANRGASGIDGVLSTALGFARAWTPTVALAGDLAFLHDQGALTRAGGVDCTMVVVDNDGGGIFSFLPQADALARDEFERLFGTPHGVDLGAIGAAHGVPVTTPDRAADVGPAVAAAVAAGGVRMVHVRTDRGANVAVHAEIHRMVESDLL